MTRPRLLLTIALGLCAVASAIATETSRFSRTVGLPVTGALVALTALAPAAEQVLKLADSFLRDQDRRDEKRVEALALRGWQDVIDQVHRSWVEPLLRGSLYEQARIELRLVERREMVETAHHGAHLPGAAERPIPPGLPIDRVYREAGRQLLLLGEPGSGKTTTMMELAEHLLEEAKSSSTSEFPVIFPLSTWSGQRSLEAWLVEELHHGYGVPRRLAERWVDTDQLVVMLDGLDEVPDERRDSCAQAINAFHHRHGLQPLVVTARAGEYRSLRPKLQLRSAIEIEPLEEADVARYLRSDPGLAGVREALDGDGQLAALLRTPLWLSFAVDAFRNRSAPDLSGEGPPDAARGQLLDRYVDTILARAAPAYSQRERIVRWLGWLATGMRDHGQTVFYLDSLQAGWLPAGRLRWLAIYGVSAAAGALAALLVGLIVWAILAGSFDQGVWMLAAACLGLLAGGLVGRSVHTRAIEPTERLRWSWPALRRHLVGQWVRVGLPVGLVFGLLVGAVMTALSSGAGSAGGIAFGLLAGLVSALTAGLVLGLLAGIVSGVEPTLFVTRPAPGEAIARSLRNGLVSGTGYALLVAVATSLVIWVSAYLDGGLLNGLASQQLFSPSPLYIPDLRTGGPPYTVIGPETGVILGVPVGLVLGSIVGMRRGGAAYLRHRVLRVLIALSGCGPLDLRRFLEYGCRLGLLRAVGGGYEFSHRLLLEHLARAE